MFACACYMKQTSIFKNLSENRRKIQKIYNNVYMSEFEATFKNLFTILDPYTLQGLSNHTTLSTI